MKLNFKKLTILSLVLAVFLSGIFCCCFTDLVQAEEPVPSCHHTTRDTDSSKNTVNCECDETLAILQKDFSKVTPSETITLLSYDNKVGYKLHSSVVSIAYYAPPIIYDTSPLYIKHSILRI